MSIFTGSGVAIVTPFNDDMSVNFEGLEKLIDFQIENKTDCIVICGTTGESSTLNDEEHLECIKVAIDRTNNRVPVIAGTGSNDTKHGIELSKRAEKLGADGLLQVTPYYNKTTQKGLVRHFSSIAKSVDIPIVLYNVPSRTGLNIDVDTAVELSKVDNIVAIKEASGNIGHITDLVARCEGNLDLYSGNDDQIVPLLSLGGKGVISVVANILPKETHDIVAKFLAGDVKGSLDLQLKLHELIKSLFCEVNPIPVKAAMNYLGLPSGPCRLPLTDMEPANRLRVENAIKKLGITI
ncbi:4-hydroxy-tetrahydrodipicolinate synthase [Vallitalea sp.]|jgi:4-hydroxy-tetrahydrodipicolinate synthase|uniref:4-hydroxy-tetrahydrodipicolinate synthase n=1 Tax=Vallitalea sp. TaxID=1882829 RepID=UPI0025E86A3B|nr:4-hydroxy-tetrahydrodipicolinate synthase [Vallitalea sp.]MCT4686555.1 4-hydroxy-tetrahydrodipicolinate synthase [Vallitalea sp.]